MFPIFCYIYFKALVILCLFEALVFQYFSLCSALMKCNNFQGWLRKELIVLLRQKVLY